LLGFLRGLLAFFSGSSKKGGAPSAPTLAAGDAQSAPPAQKEASAQPLKAATSAAAEAPQRVSRENQNGALPGRERAATLDSKIIAQAHLHDDEEALFREIDHRIETGKFDLPQLPSTSMAIMSLVNDPRVEIPQLTRMISSDPVLSGQLVRTANSALYAGSEPIKTIQDGVMRIGTRALRTLVLSASMKGILLTGKGVASYGKSVWRQSLSVARIAWAIGPKLGFEKDSAFLLALLHDVGKLPLLAMLDEESRKGRQVSRALIGKVFQRFHERVGRALAVRWKLGDEIVSITGCHHDFAANVDFPRSAALVSLAHKLDLYQSLGDERGFEALASCEELAVLGAQSQTIRQILDLATQAYNQPDSASGEEAQAA
jgi:HD-like signal output (HDOD) protein